MVETLRHLGESLYASSFLFTLCHVLSFMLPTVSPFSNEWITSVVFLLGIFGLIGLSELARVKLNWTPELSRKFVHVLVGLFVLMSPFLFVSNGPPVALAIILL